MKCPECKSKMRVDAKERKYICDKCNHVVEWYNSEDIEKNPSPLQY